jgi:hypothetical protein
MNGNWDFPLKDYPTRSWKHFVDFKWQADDVTRSREEENMCLKLEEYNQSTRSQFRFQIIVVFLALLLNDFASFAWNMIEFAEICTKWLMLGAFPLCFGKMSENGVLDFLLLSFEIEDLLNHTPAGPNYTVIRPQQLLER